MKASNPIVQTEVNDFLARRFAAKDKWEDGNCYYMATILSTRFWGEIYYAPIENHFVCKIGSDYYDINGLYEPQEKLYKWDNYYLVDEIESQRIWRDCIS